MKTYDTIKVLDGQLATIPDGDEDSRYHVCWTVAPEIAQSLESDLKEIGGGCPRVNSLKFKLGDLDHQGANTCVAHLSYDPWDVFDVAVTMIINHGVIHVFVRRRPQKTEFEAIADRLDKGEFAHLRNLKK